MNKLLYLMLSFLLLNCRDPEQKKDSEIILDSKIIELEKMILEQKKSFNVPGLAIGIIKDGEVIYANGFGLQNMSTGDSMTVKSIFHMASVSKPFVATAILQLKEQKKIDLNNLLIDYLPDFSMDDESYKKITISHILTHSSGIPDVKDYEWDNPQYDNNAAERYAQSFMSKKLDFAPGEKYSYSNAAFNLLAGVISNVSGMTFETYMEEAIFKPTGMINTTFYKPEVSKKYATAPHILDSNLKMNVSDVYPYNRIHAPSSTLHSNIEDMLLWAKTNLNKGTIEKNKIYDHISYKLLTSGYREIAENDSIGLSWLVSSYKSYKIIRHSGGDLGYSTYMSFIPEKKSAIVLMGNNNILWSSDVSNSILKYILFNESDVLKTPIHFALKDHILTKEIEEIKDVYFSKKKNELNKYNFEIWTLDELGYWLLDRRKNKKALEIFLFNLELFPNHPALIDSVADAYRALGDKKMAVFWYNKALKIKPDQEFTRKKLDELIISEK